MNLERFDDVIRVFPEAMLLVSGAGELLAVNTPAAELLQRSPRQLCGRMLQNVVTESDDIVRRYLSACERSRQMVPGKLTWLLPGTDAKPLRMEGAALRPWSEKEPALLIFRLRPRESASSGVLLLNSQISQLNKEILLRRIAEDELNHLNERLETEVLQRTEELQTLNEELQRSNRELQDFAYVASHDLQEPLRKITTFSDLLLTESGARLDETDRSYLERVRNAAYRMSALLKGLFEYSRLATQVQPFERINLNTLVRDVLTDMEVALEASGGQVDVGPLPEK